MSGYVIALADAPLQAACLPTTPRRVVMQEDRPLLVAQDTPLRLASLAPQSTVVVRDTPRIHLALASFGAPAANAGTVADEATAYAVAQTALGYPRLIAVADGQAYLPDLASPTDMTRLAGFTDQSWAAGDTARIVRALVISEPTWNWTPGLVFAAASGTFTQSPDPMLALVQVGVAINPTTLSLRLSSPLLR